MTGNWALHVSDPQAKRRREDNNDDVDKESYYRPFVEMVHGSDTTETVAGMPFLVANLPGRSTRVGMDQRIYEALSSHRRRGADEIVARIEDCLHPGYGQDAANPNIFISPEGIFTESVG